MANYDFTNFERQGNIENDTQLGSLQETSEFVIKNTENTLRTIKLFTPDLEPEIYNNDKFRKAMLDFTRGNRHAQIQILTKDITNAFNNGHMLISLAQQLPSILIIKDIPKENQGTSNSFILFDQSNFIYKPDATSHEAISSSCKKRSERLNEFYTTIWEHAEQNGDTRQLRI